METSAHTLSWMLCRLAFHTDVQERLYAEAKEFVGRFTEVSPESAPYVYAVIHETLRLHPAVNVLPLMVRDGVTMEGHALETVRDALSALVGVWCCNWLRRVGGSTSRSSASI